MAVPVNPEEYRQLAAGPSAISKYTGARDQTYMPIAQQVIQERLRGRRPQDMSKEMAMLERERLRYMQGGGGLTPADIARAHSTAQRGAGKSGKPLNPLKPSERKIVDARVEEIKAIIKADKDGSRSEEIGFAMDKALKAVEGVSNNDLRHRLNDYLWERVDGTGVGQVLKEAKRPSAGGRSILEESIDYSGNSGKLPSAPWDPGYVPYGTSHEQGRQPGAPGASYEKIIADMQAASGGGPDQAVLDRFDAEMARLQGQHGRPQYKGRLIAPIEQVDTGGFDALLRGPSSAPPTAITEPPPGPQVGGGGSAAGPGPSVSPSSAGVPVDQEGWSANFNELMMSPEDAEAAGIYPPAYPPAGFEREDVYSPVGGTYSDPTARAFAGGLLDPEAHGGLEPPNPMLDLGEETITGRPPNPMLDLGEETITGYPPLQGLPPMSDGPPGEPGYSRPYQAAGALAGALAGERTGRETDIATIDRAPPVEPTYSFGYGRQAGPGVPVPPRGSPQWTAQALKFAQRKAAGPPTAAPPPGGLTTEELNELLYGGQ